MVCAYSPQPWMRERTMNAPATALEITHWLDGDQAGALARYRVRTGEPLMVASRTLREDAESSLVPGYGCKRCGHPEPAQDVLKHTQDDCISFLRERLERLEAFVNEANGITITT
jgi:hypothetical protein